MRDYTFGNLVTALRTERGFSQYQLGRLLGVSDKAVSKWENGNAKPRISTCYRLAEVLGVSLDELLSSSDRRRESADEAESDPAMNEAVFAGMKREKTMGGRLVLYPEKRVELHMKTNMSISDGIVSIRDLIDRTVEWGMPAATVTDFCNTRAFPLTVPLYRRKEQKIILGCEGYMIPSASAPAESGCHVMLLVRNREGLVHLNKLVSLSCTEYFRGVPCMPKELIEQYREGLLIGSSCEEGEIVRRIRENAPQEELKACARFYDYFEVQPVENEPSFEENPDEACRRTLETNIRKVLQLAGELGKPAAAVSNARYLDPEDGLSRAVLQYGSGFENAELQPLYYLRTTKEMTDAFSFLGAETAREIVVGATQAIAGLIDDQIDLFPAGTGPDGPALPVIPEAESHLRNLAMLRARQIYGETLPAPVSERLEKEFGFISAQRAWPTLETARLAVSCSLREGFPAGNRGHIGASLTAYLVGVSRVNPLPPHYFCADCGFALFTAPSRSGCGADLPGKNCPRCGKRMSQDGFDIPVETFLGLDGKRQMDIDLNVSAEIQEKVHQYIRDFFGADRVIRPGTAAGLSEERAEKMAFQYADDHNMKTDADDVKRAASQITGAVRFTGQHPGGLIIVPAPYDVNDFTPVQYSSDGSADAMPVTHYEFYSMHDVLLKMNILSHDTPTMLMLMHRISGAAPEGIPLNDPGVLSLFLSPDALGVSEKEILSPNGTAGIPEFDSRFVRNMLREIRPTTVEELIRISGLAHGTGVWTGNVENLIREKKADVCECPATRDDITNYLTRHGMAFDTAFRISEDVRKGKGMWKTEIAETLRKAGIPDWYIDCCEKIVYMFPRAHAAAYVADSLRLAWYKLYHPEAFYPARLRVWGENLEAADLTMDAVRLRKAILSIRMDLQDCGDRCFSEEISRKKDREAALRLLLEMKLRGCRLPDDFFQPGS